MSVYTKALKSVSWENPEIMVVEIPKESQLLLSTQFIVFGGRFVFNEVPAQSRPNEINLS